jgi:hypothetical protein
VCFPGPDRDLLFVRRSGRDHRRPGHVADCLVELACGSLQFGLNLLDVCLNAGQGGKAEVSGGPVRTQCLHLIKHGTEPADGGRPVGRTLLIPLENVLQSHDRIGVVLTEPERAREVRPVDLAPQQPGYQSPRRCARSAAVSSPGEQSRGECAEVVGLSRPFVLIDGLQTGDLQRDILDRPVVGRGDDDLEAGEAFVQCADRADVVVALPAENARGKSVT